MNKQKHAGVGKPYTSTSGVNTSRAVNSGPETNETMQRDVASIDVGAQGVSNRGKHRVRDSTSLMVTRKKSDDKDLPHAKSSARVSSSNINTRIVRSKSDGNMHETTRVHKTLNTKADTSVKCLSDALKGLDSEKEYRVNNALIWIRSTLIKQPDGTKTLMQHGGLKKLLRILGGSNRKFQDITLSILGNIATDDKVRLQILRLDAIHLIVDIMKSVTDENMRNRACRTLANLAQNPKCCQAIHNEGLLVEETSSKPISKQQISDDAAPSVVQCIIDYLDSTQNTECKLTYLRALRLLGDTDSHRDVIIEQQGVKMIGACLKNQSSSRVLLSSLKTIGHYLHLTKTEPAIWQFVNAEGAHSLLMLSKHENENVSSTAASLMLAFAKHELLRPCLGNAGAIQYLVDSINELNSSPKQKFAYINALCLFCQEVVNRAKIREAKGLEVFLRLLDDADYFVLHYRLVSALVFFLYDDVGLDILLQNNLVRILLKQLRKCAKIESLNLEEIFSKCVHGSYLYYNESTKRRSSESPADNLDITAEAGESEFGKNGHNYTVGSDLKFNSENKIDELSGTAENTNLKKEETAEEKQCAFCSENAVDSKEKEEKKEDVSEKSVPKYSIDSPTYKSMSDWSYEQTGPLNIFEAQKSSRALSPNELYPYHSPPHSSPYSPMTTSPYHSPAWSVSSGSDRASSPVSGSASSRENSPIRSSSPCVSESAFSDVESWGGSSSNGSRPASPLAVYSPQISPKGQTDFQNLWWGVSPSLQKALKFSNEDTGELKRISVETECKVTSHSSKRKRQHSGDAADEISSSTCRRPDDVTDDAMMSSQDTSYSGPLYSDPLYEYSMNTDFGKALRGESLLRQISSESTDPLLGLNTSKCKRRRTSLKLASSTDTLERHFGERSHSTDTDKPKEIGTCLLDQMPECHAEVGNITGKSKPPGGRSSDPAKTTEHSILVILSKLSYCDDPSARLVTADVFETLIVYLLCAKRPYHRAERILSRLCSNIRCVEAVMRLYIPVALHLASMCTSAVPCDVVTSGADQVTTDAEDKQVKGLTINAGCADVFKGLVTKLSVIVTSQYGKGVMTHALLSGDVGERTAAVLALPVCCRDEEVLRKCMVKHDGLRILLEDLKRSHAEKDKKALMYASHAVHRLAIHADIMLLHHGVGMVHNGDLFDSIPRASHRLESASDANHPCCKRTEEVITFELEATSSEKERTVSENTDSKKTVTFLVESQKVLADRQVMVAKSQVFAAMLEGPFSERSQSEVKVQHASYKAFRIFCDIIHGDISSIRSLVLSKYRMDNSQKLAENPPHLSVGNCVEPCLENSTDVEERILHSTCSDVAMETGLEILELCNRFLLSDVKCDVTNVVYEHLVDWSNVVQVLEFAITHNCQLLATRAIAHVTSCCVAMETRATWFDAILKSTKCDDITECMYETLRKHLPLTLHVRTLH